MASVTDNLMETDDEYVPPVKLKKTTSEVDHNDLYCFECHDEGDVICCDTCPRVYHPKCLALTTLPEGDDWTCPECKILQADFNITNHSMAEFHTMLKFALRRMKSHPQAAPFMQPVDSEQMPEYLDYIIHPMDLETLDKNIDLKKYTSTDAFIGDVKWITHNSVVFNGGQSKFTAVARALLKIARHEMTEIEICSECYLRSAQPLTTDWFAEPCTIPHTLCWAKMKGYQPWPAKVLRIVNDEVDVRFFGQHDRAWVPINNCFVLSKEYPGLEKKKSNVNFEKSLTELQTHIDKLKTVYGTFNYAPLQTPLSKTKPFKFVSTIDDCVQPTYVTIGINSSAVRSSVKSVKQARSPIPQLPTEPTTMAQPTTKRANEDSPDQQETVKRARLSSRTSEDANANGSRIVLRIRKPSEDLSSNRSDTSNSSSSHQVTVQIREPLLALQEDEEDDQTESPPALVVDMQTHTDDTSDSSHKDEEARSASPTSQPSPACPTPSPSIPNEPVQPACASPIEYVDPNAADVRLTMHVLLDAVDALKSISEVRTHPPPLTLNEPLPMQLPFAERRTTAKQPRKSRLQHRIVTSQPKPLPLSHISLPSDERSGSERILSPSSITVPLRPLSISPASVDTAEEAGTSTSDDAIPPHRPVAKSKSIDALNVKSEPIDSDNHAQRRPNQPAAPVKPSTPASSPSMSTKSFLISPPAVPHLHKTKTPAPALSATSTPALPAMIPNSNNTFAPRISSTASQKAAWLPTSSSQMPSSTRQPPNTASKRPTAPLHPPTALRNSNPNPTTMRRTPPATTLQPQSFDMFAVNPPAARRPNGLPPPTLASTTPPLPARNPPPRLPQFNNHAVRPPIDEHQTPAEIQTIVKTFNDKFQQLLTDFTVKIESALESNRVKYERELEETRRTYRLSMNELRTVTTQQVQEMHNSLELQYWTRLSEMRARPEPHHPSKAPKQFNGAPR